MEAPASRWRRLLLRAPLLLLLAAGLWFWRGGAGLVPVERQLVFLLPGDRTSMREVELQIYEHEELIKRELLLLPSGLGLDPVQKLPLRAGTYPTQVFILRSGGEREAYSPVVQVLGEDTIVIKVGPTPSSVDPPKDGGI